MYDLEVLAAANNALSNAHRLRLLLALAELGEQPIARLCGRLGLSDQAARNHAGVLAAAGLVTCRDVARGTRGRAARHYSLARPALAQAATDLATFAASLHGEEPGPALPFDEFKEAG